MKIAILADIHDNVWALHESLEVVADSDVLLFCGDFCSPFTLVQMAEGFGKPIHIVWGNNDGDKYLLTRNACRFEHVLLHGELAEIELGGLRIGINHYPEIAGRLAGSGCYDLVCYGHDHVAHDSRVGECRLLNPGEVMGRLGTSTAITFDTDSGISERRIICSCREYG